jgi:N-acyl-D-amino-acid deacylase
MAGHKQQDLVLRGARIADGTGAPVRRADVRVYGGHIAEVGDIAAGDGARTVDLSGLVLAPGFIDPHTHYDAQVFWDPELTPTCWHGVTTVLTGNCGFGIAPLHAEQRTLMAETLENVEGMAANVLAAGIPWTFETFPEYLDAVSALPLRLNVAPMIGHTPVRLFVMGEAAMERPASEAEIGHMRDLVNEGLAHGAHGFSTSRSPTHQGADGRPVPSRVADPGEIRELAGALLHAGKGILQITPGPALGLREMADIAASINRPVTWTALFTGLGSDLLAAAGSPGTTAELLRQTKSLGGSVYPQIASLPQVMQVTLADPFPFGMLPSFKRVLSASRPDRTRIYRDPAWVAAARAELSGRWQGRWAKTTIDESEAHQDLQHGPSLAELAARQQMHPFDFMVALSLEEDLRTRFRCVLANDDEQELAPLLREPQCLLAVSDGGAHVSQLCDARYPTHFLRHWVREKGVLSLEEAIWRLAGQPAALIGLHDRGTIAPGKIADLVAFDFDKVTDLEPQRVWDLPDRGDRLIARAEGIHAVWVNGQATISDGVPVPGPGSGRLLRSGSS